MPAGRFESVMLSPLFRVKDALPFLNGTPHHLSSIVVMVSSSRVSSKVNAVS